MWESLGDLASRVCARAREESTGGIRAPGEVKGGNQPKEAPAAPPLVVSARDRPREAENVVAPARRGGFRAGADRDFHSPRRLSSPRRVCASAGEALDLLPARPEWARGEPAITPPGHGSGAIHDALRRPGW